MSQRQRFPRLIDLPPGSLIQMDGHTLTLESVSVNGATVSERTPKTIRWKDKETGEPAALTVNTTRRRRIASAVEVDAVLRFGPDPSDTPAASRRQRLASICSASHRVTR